MENSKIKNLIIIILVFVNVVLASALGADWLKNDMMRREALSGVTDILAAHGIALAQDADISDATLAACSAQRDFSAEKRHVTAVLGKVSVQDQGGNILFYQGENGQAEFRGTGVFNILMNDKAVKAGSDPESTARSFLRKLGIAAVGGTGSASVDVTDGSGTVILYCRSGDAEIVNCSVTFTFASGSLILVTGTRPLDTVSVDASKDNLGLATVLMRFLDIVNESGRVCSVLNDAELCYIQNASTTSGTVTLTPVWRLTTDAGEFYVDGLTGFQVTAA
jgi:hypothetical protein